MREIKTEIEINAPINEVWNTLTDIKQWQDWCQIMVATSGTAAKGETLDITMIGENGKSGPNYKPTITHLKQPKYFKWRTKMMGGFMFVNDKIFELSETKTGTKLVHIEAFGGLMVTMFWGKLESDVPKMLNRMNVALKTKLENQP